VHGARRRTTTAWASVARPLRLVPPTGAAAVALVVDTAIGGISALMVALVIGIVIANSGAARWGLLQGQGETTKWFLRWGIVLLGLKLPVDEVIAAGPGVVAVVSMTVVVTYISTVRLGAWLRIDRSLVVLIAAGTCICGAAAIAVVSDAVRPTKRDLTLAIALITVQGSVLIVALPKIAGLLSLSQEQAAIWAGASIHEVAQVVASAAIVGGGALALATTVKLGRVALLAPLHGVISRAARQSKENPAPAHVPLVPWFIAGFMVAVAIRSVDVLPSSTLVVADQLTTLLLSGGMFGLGLALRLADLWPLPWRAVYLATASTGVVGGTSLLMIALFIA